MLLKGYVRCMFCLFAPQANVTLSSSLDALDILTDTALNTEDQPREVADKLSELVDGPVPATYHPQNDLQP